ncbi:MAG: tetratricopeptide repeat protein [Bacteroidales bacterium]|nr:tetratricopeptide repeat protein [Bacteroidales bacterium]
MQNKLIYIFLILTIFTSCAVFKKTKQSTANTEEKKELQFIYLFDEANKNRLNGNMQTALEQYTAAIEINPQSAASFFYTASIFISEKKYKTALSYANKAVNLQENNFWYNLEKADLLYLTGKQEDAIKIYENLLKNNPNKELLYRKLSDIYIKTYETEKLISLYEKQQKQLEYSSEIAEKLFNLYLKQKNYSKAENLINNLIIKYPGKIQYRGMAAEFYYSVNKVNKAEKMYNVLLKKYPDNPDVNLSYALFCKKTDRHEEFFKTTKKLMNSDLNFFKKTSLLNSGQYPNFPKNEYLILLNELYKHNSDRILANTLFAEYYLNNNNKKDAVPYIQKTLELNPSDFNIAEMLFSLYYDLKDFTKLKNETEKYLSYFPNQPKIFLYNGIANYNLKNYSKAEKILKTGKNLIIDNVRLKDQFNFYLALIYKQTNRIKEAQKFAEEIINDKNNDIKIYELYGDLQFVNNNKEKALKYWKLAQKNGNTSKHLKNKIININTITVGDVLNN